MAAQGSDAAAAVADDATADAEPCVACGSAPRTVLLTACGHRSLCSACFTQLAKMPFTPGRPAACPLCRVPVVGAGFKRTREGEPLPSYEAAAVDAAPVARVENFRRNGACKTAPYVGLRLIFVTHAANPQPRCMRECSRSVPWRSTES